MDNPISDTGEALYELGKDTGKKFVREVVKGVVKSAKQQVTGKVDEGSEQQEKGAGASKPKTDDNKSPVTGQPVPSKRVLSDLQQKVAQLQMAKLAKIREELANQRLKTSQPGTTGAAASSGPEVPAAKPKPKEDIVSKTLKSAQSTGEIKGGGYG